MFDYIKIFKELNRRRIKYIVVGGLAVNLHGIPRATYDIDLLLSLEKENLKKFLNFLKKIGFKPRVSVELVDFLDEDNRKRWIKEKNMKAFTLVNPKWVVQEIDIIVDAPIDYNKAIKNVKIIKVHNVAIPVISVRDLILMKKKSCRLQDKSDVRYLKKLLEQ